MSLFSFIFGKSKKPKISHDELTARWWIELCMQLAVKPSAYGDGIRLSDVECLRMASIYPFPYRHIRSCFLRKPQTEWERVSTRHLVETTAKYAPETDKSEDRE